jgi:hypothetical protein
VADWPDPAELKKILNVEGPDSDEWDATLDRVMASAISRVKGIRGSWDDAVDAPDENMAAAALRMAELLALRPEAAADSIKDPTFDRLMSGRRRVFGVG